MISKINMYNYGSTHMLIVIAFVTFTLGSCVFANEKVDREQPAVARGEVQSCRGCSLKRLPDVRAFIFDDLPKYTGVEFHPIQGAVPHLVLFDKSDKEIERIDLSGMSRKECNNLVLKWFKTKEESEERKEKSRQEL